MLPSFKLVGMADVFILVVVIVTVLSVAFTFVAVVIVRQSTSTGRSIVVPLGDSVRLGKKMIDGIVDGVRSVVLEWKCIDRWSFSGTRKRFSG